MFAMTANQAKTQFGLLLDTAQREPVQVLKHNRVVGVLVSARDYEDMRAFYASRARQTIQTMQKQAAANGLDEDTLTALLADES